MNLRLILKLASFLAELANFAVGEEKKYSHFFRNGVSKYLILIEPR